MTHPEQGVKPAMSANKYPCTQCGGDATVAYSASKDAEWGGMVKIGERLCTRCFQVRGGVNMFAHTRVKSPPEGA